MDLSPVSFGGTAALIVAVGFALKYALEGWAAWRARPPGVKRDKPDPTKDTAAVIEFYDRALARAEGRISDLETEVQEEREQRRRLERDYDKISRDLAKTRRELEQMAARVGTLQATVREAVRQVETEGGRHTDPLNPREPE